MKKAIIIGLGITALTGIALVMLNGCCGGGVCQPGCCPFC
jgi:hypothetical protein